MRINKKISKDGELTWLDIEDPSELFFRELRKGFRFQSGDINECRHFTRRPRLMERKNYIFLILHIPVFDRTTNRTSAAELDFFITQDHIITIHKQSILSLDYIKVDLDKLVKRKKEFLTGYLLYEILKDIFEELFKKLDHISEKIDQLEDLIFEKKNVVDEIMIIKRDIWDFRKVVKPQRTVLDPLVQKTSKFWGEPVDIQFKSIISLIIHVWNILQHQTELVETLEKTNESVLVYKSNQTMLILTIVSVILMPLSILGNLAPDSLILNSLRWFVVAICCFTIFGMLAFVAFKKSGLKK